MFGGTHDEPADTTAGTMQDSTAPVMPAVQNPVGVSPANDADGGASTLASSYNPAALADAVPAGTDAVQDSPAVTTAPAAPDDGSTALDSSDDLLSIKQQALQQLSPLVGHLEQSPEEKFRTTMMMIQASDNQALIKDAYAAAQAITDEKTRAQALLDIVNEINYFTQHAAQQQ
ncbi:MAG TPA: hypothetical protein VLI54_02510 [Bacillota bacterium]|nr:hypothetical protein [Bacillota bacterium]